MSSMLDKALYTVMPFLERYEKGFDGEPWVEFSAEHGEIPVFAIALYLVVVFYVPDYLKKPLKLKGLWAVWNLALAVFSTLGALRVVPTLVGALFTRGLRYSVCEYPTWYITNSEGLWTVLFIYSKIPELVDTLFLVFQKKPVIYLHWYHHISVLLYCWHAFVTRTSPGIWFVAMNFTVHSVMYLYYFLMVAGIRSLARPVAPFITVMQLTQMVVGIFVTAYAYSEKLTEGAGDEPCHVNPSNARLGLMMYLSYFLLFAVLFYNLYIKPGGKHATKKRSAASAGTTPQCTAGDAAGFFHGDSDRGEDGARRRRPRKEE